MSDVSVIIPAYNGEKFIEEALRSLFAQKCPAEEIIVIDDGSTDGTASVLEKYRKQVSYHFQENSGLAAARNAGIRVSKGAYLAFLDADDLFHPEKIEVQKTFLDSHPEIDMVFSDFEYFGGMLLRRPIPDSLKKGEGNLLLDLFRFNCIAIPTVLLRRECFQEVGSFDESLLAVEDYDLWLRLVKRKKIGYVDHVLAKVRLHPENMSKDADLMRDYEIRVMDKAIKDNPDIEDRYSHLIKEKRGIVYFETGYRHLLGQGMEKARQNFILAMKSRPFWIKPYVYYFTSFGGPAVLHAARRIKRSFSGKK
jgi:glycosyltransferase involved in cell wall biosynthesis